MMIYLNLISNAIAIVAFGVSLSAYRLSRKLPNENKIFEEKIRCYHTLIKAMNQAVGEILVCLNEYAENKRQKAPDLSELEDELNEAINDAFFELENAISENSLVVPNNVLAKAYEFLDLLDKPEYLKKYFKDSDFNKFEGELNEFFDIVVVAMQDDIGFEKLDNSLKRRTGGKRLHNHSKEEI